MGVPRADAERIEQELKEEAAEKMAMAAAGGALQHKGGGKK
jgi:hypothetical protein